MRFFTFLVVNFWNNIQIRRSFSVEEKTSRLMSKRNWRRNQLLSILLQSRPSSKTNTLILFRFKHSFYCFMTRSLLKHPFKRFLMRMIMINFLFKSFNSVQRSLILWINWTLFHKIYHYEFKWKREIRWVRMNINDGVKNIDWADNQ